MTDYGESEAGRVPTRFPQGRVAGAGKQGGSLMWSVGRMVRGVGLGGLWLSMAGACRPVVAQALNNVVRPTCQRERERLHAARRPGLGLHRAHPERLEPAGRDLRSARCRVAKRSPGRLTWTGAAYVGCAAAGVEVRRVRRARRRDVQRQRPGSGDVQVSGEVTRDKGAPGLYLRWSPARDTEVDVEGSCPGAVPEGPGADVPHRDPCGADPAAEGGRRRDRADARGPTVEGAGLAVRRVAGAETADCGNGER